jgi:long-chain acyl-CoA synthetase
MNKAGLDTEYTRSEESYLNHVRALQAELWPAGVPREPVYPHGRRPLTHYLGEWARRQPEKAAVLFYGQATSYAELDRLSNKFAS